MLTILTTWRNFDPSASLCQLARRRWEEVDDLLPADVPLHLPSAVVLTQKWRHRHLFSRFTWTWFYWRYNAILIVDFRKCAVMKWYCYVSLVNIFLTIYKCYCCSFFMNVVVSIAILMQNKILSRNFYLVSLYSQLFQVERGLNMEWPKRTWTECILCWLNTTVLNIVVQLPSNNTP